MDPTTPRPQKKKSPAKAFLWLALIPGQLLLDVLLMLLAVRADSLIFSNPAPDAVGHPFPAVTLLAFLALLVVTVIVIVLSIILTIATFVHRKKKNSNYSAGAEQ